MIIVEIAGNLGDDAEDRHTPTGKRVIILRVATRTRRGETIWWRVNIWEENCQKLQPMLPYLKKGTGLIIIGEMNKPETFVGKDGTTQVSLTLNAEIVKFSPFGKGNSQGSSQQTASKPVEQPAMAAATAQEVAFTPYGTSFDQDTTGDDLPF